jgi:hypothetical protein
VTADAQQHEADDALALAPLVPRLLVLPGTPPSNPEWTFYDDLGAKLCLMLALESQLRKEPNLTFEEFAAGMRKTSIKPEPWGQDAWDEAVRRVRDNS